QNDLLAARSKNVAEALLGATLATVSVGGVEAAHSEIERLVHDAARGFKTDALAEIVAAEPKQRHLQARRSQSTQFHHSSPALTLRRSIEERIDPNRNRRKLKRFSPSFPINLTGR